MAELKEYHGLAIDKVLADNVNLPKSGTNVYTDDYELIGKTGNRLKVVFFANSDFTVPNANAFAIEVLAGTSEDPTTTPVTNAHIYPLHITSSDGDKSFSDGDLITSWVIDEDLLGSNNHIRFKLTSDTDLTSKQFSAFVVASV